MSVFKVKKLWIVAVAALTACSGPQGASVDLEPAEALNPEAMPSENGGSQTGDVKTGNAKLKVTLSCRMGALPKRQGATMPLNATFLRLDVKPDYEIYGLEEDDPKAFTGKLGSDGMADFWLPAGVEAVEIKVLPMMDENGLNIGSHNVANDKDQSVIVERGKTVTKSFILEQAYCDEFREIRGIGGTNFSAVLEDLGPDYDAEDGIRVVGMVGSAAQKRFYTRSVANDGLIRGQYNTPKLDESRRFMRVRNIMSVRRIKRICGDAKFNLDMTIRSNMELGTKTFSGTGPSGQVNCRKAYTTHMPVSFIKDYGNDDFFHVEKEGGGIALFPKHNSVMDIREVRSTCEPEAKMLEAPFDWEISCFEADQTSSKIIEYGKGDPLGTTHSFTIRHDLGGLELIEGKVNPGVNF